MKFFHLGDLHLGKCIHGYSMIEMGDQPFWIEQLLKKAEELKPDAIVIAGDVYDRAVPSKEAVNLFDEFLTKLAEMKIAVLLIAGNHDSGSRLAFGDKLLCHQGVYIAGEVKKDICCITISDEYGPIHFWLIPYLFPAAVQVLFDREDLKDYDSAMRVLLDAQSIDFSQRNVVVSHQFVMAGTDKPVMGGSETTVGGIGQIDASVFDGFDYAALGHIHNAQRMGKETVRYAGSPLSYHFSEAGQKKGLTVVEIKEKSQVEIFVEELPVLHKMCEVSGTMDEILQASVEKNSYVRAVFKQEVLPPQAVEILRTHFQSKECVLMEVVRDFSVQSKKSKEFEVKDVQSLSLEELFTQFYSYLHQGNLPDAADEKLISFAAEQSRNYFEDETEAERRKAAQQLVDYAVSRKDEEVL